MRAGNPVFPCVCIDSGTWPAYYSWLFAAGLDSCDRGIAQPGSAPALGAGCREFESLYPDQLVTVHAPVAHSDRASAFGCVLKVHNEEPLQGNGTCRVDRTVSGKP